MFECVCTEGQCVCIGTLRNTDATYEMKSIIGNAVNLSIADVRLDRVLPADTVIRVHVRGKRGQGMGGAIGNADSASGILMAVLETSCALWFCICVHARTDSRVGEHTLLLIAFPWSVWQRVMANV